MRTSLRIRFASGVCYAWLPNFVISTHDFGKVRRLARLGNFVYAKSVTFPYILHWKPNLDRRLVLENDFVRFRSREV